MRLAIFADLHGKILLPFKLVDFYQQATGERIDAILQCGDIGAFPDLKRLDKATIKHAQYSRDELGFHDDFAQENPAIRAFLERLNLDMICVRGNHEDHDFLDMLEAQAAGERFAIDVYRRVFICKSGVPQTLQAGEELLRFVGIGRIGDRKGRTEKRFIQAYERAEIEKLPQTNAIFDILITHDKDDSSQRGYGMAEIRQVLDTVLFRYHFYGHTGEPFSHTQDENGITQSVKIKELEFNESGILGAGCMVILEKAGEDFRLKTVEQSFTNHFTAHGWRYV